MVRYLHRERFFAAHRAEDLVLIAEVIRQYRPAALVELGTYLGGMAAFFADTIAAWGGTVHTFDVRRQFDQELLQACPNLRFYEEDILRESPVVKALIAKPSTLLYCDNGDKEAEIAAYAPVLAVGNLLGCHDYESEVRADFVEPLLAGLGFSQHRHADFAALAAPPWYPVSMTRFWRRRG
jgi:cephalosporin hydroxylase